MEHFVYGVVGAAVAIVIGFLGLVHHIRAILKDDPEFNWSEAA